MVDYYWDYIKIHKERQQSKRKMSKTWKIHLQMRKPIWPQIKIESNLISEHGNGKQLKDDMWLQTTSLTILNFGENGE